MADGGAAPPPEAVRRSMSKGMLTMVVVVVAVLAFAGGIGVGMVFFGGGGGPPAKEFLITGTNVPFPPFEDFNTTSGQFEGFDIDIAKLVAEEAGRTLVIQQFADFQALLTTVGQGGVDMAVSAITITAARNNTMDFANPYYNANQGILVQTSSTLTCANSVCEPTDLASLTIGVQLGTTSEAWIDENVAPLMSDPANQIVRYTQVDTELAALRLGSLDAVMLDAAPAESFASAPSSGLRVAGLVITGELYGFAVPNGDPDGLVAIINRVLARIMSDGTYDQLIEKWFG